MNLPQAMPTRVIPIIPAKADTTAATPTMATEPAGSACGSSEESFALMVLGESMLPEFAEGDIIIVEPDGQLQDRSYVIARTGDEWALRQLLLHAGRWWLRAHDPRIADLACPDLGVIRGVVIQKRSAGRRRHSKNYIEPA